MADEAKKAEAKAHFDKGLNLLAEEAWSAALAEFLESRALFPTRAATTNAATCLRKLQRYDESLDMYEAVLRDFPNLKSEDRTFVQRAVVELRALVGTIDITGAEPGATIVVSGQSRGEYPPPTPLRVGAGAHLVRVFKEGYEPFETRVDVAGGQQVRLVVKLRALTESGRLRVTERGGGKVDVLVDNAVVGQTPWEGTLAVGNHVVALRGKGRTGSQPASARVKSRELATLNLTAEELDSSLRVQPTPAGAGVSIDGVLVGDGVWEGSLKAGSHHVEVTSDGFYSGIRDVKLEHDGRITLDVKLDRDPNSVQWRKPSHWIFDASAGFTFIPTLAGSASRCTGACSASLTVGGLGFLNVGYQTGSGVGFGVGAGYLIATQSVKGATANGDLVPYHDSDGLPGPQKGTNDNAVRLSGFLGGASLFYHIGDKLPVLLRLGVGAMVGRVRDSRTGHYTASDGTADPLFPVTDMETAVSLYVDPEVRFGFRLGKHVDLSIGAQALLLVGIRQPTWNPAIQVNAGHDGIGNYLDTNPITAPFIIAVTPSASLRYEF